MTRPSGNAIAYLGRPGSRAGDTEADLAADITIGLVPADRVSVVTIDLPEVRGAKLAQALRWAAEDALAGDAEQQHVVPIERRGDGRMVCAVAARDDMQRWCADADGLVRVVPDAAALPWHEGELVLAAAGDAVLARWGRNAFDRLEADLLDALLPDLIDQAGTARVVWYGDAPPACVSALEPERRGAGTSIEALLAEGAAASPMNLRYGEFAPSRERNRPRFGWTLALLAVAAVLLIADAAVEIAQLENRSSALQGEIERRASSAFPDLELLPGRERVQLERAVGGRTAGDDGFVRLLRRIAPLFSTLDALTVESMNWSDARLDLTLRAPGLPDLEALQRQLEQRGPRVRVEDVAVEAGAVRARMVIEPGDGT